MNKLKRSIIFGILLILTACGGGGSEIDSTRSPLPGGEVHNLGSDWETICIDEVKYIFKSSGSSGGIMSPYFKQDGTLHTCEVLK